MKKMKKISILLAFLTLVVSSCCRDLEPMPEPSPEPNKPVGNSELIVGEWVYDDPINGIWEEQKFLSNGKLYYSAFYLNPYLWIENSDGIYMFTSNEKKMTLVYSSVLGEKTYLDVEIKEINDFSYTGRFINSDGSYGGTYTYHRLVDRKKISLRETITPAYGDITKESEIISYSSNDTSIVVVDSKNGRITAKERTGQTYICIQTTSGNAYVEVIVNDPNNLFPDFSAALNMNYMEVLDKWGDCNKEYPNTMRYPIRGNEYAKLATLWFDDGKNVNYLQIELKTPVSISSTEKKVHEYLSTKYEYQYKEDGVYTYFDFSQPEILPMAIFYIPSENSVEYLKIELQSDLWTDYALDFGKTASELKVNYGTPFYEDIQSLYFLQDNDFIEFVGFSINEITNTAYAAGAFLKTDCDWQKALDFVANKYYYYEQGSDENEYFFAFTNKSSLQESTIGITFDGVNGLITYVDLTASRAISTRIHTSDFPYVKIERPN